MIQGVRIGLTVIIIPLFVASIVIVTLSSFIDMEERKTEQKPIFGIGKKFMIFGAVCAVISFLTFMKLWVM